MGMVLWSNHSQKNMEGGSELDDAKKPLLNKIVNGRDEVVHCQYSFTSLMNDFLSKLPQKVQIALDPESPFDFNLSHTSGLIRAEKEYYERQVATLKSFEEVDGLDSPLDINEEEEDQEQAQHERAMNISNVANIILLVLKIYATLRSGSLAIAASTLDSLLDLMAGGILWFTHLSMKNINIYQYPIGKLRVQPVGIVIFAAVMATLVLGDRFYWWIDPFGAIALAVYTITNWSGTVLENAVSLVGQAAPPEVLQKLTYLVIRHHTQIKRVDTVRAYTFGALYFVEVDIELPEDLPLKEAHAIGESLQIKIEMLPEVERAFVHLDFECDHKPEHSVLNKLPNTQP
ncbi:metal tolerance protein 4-like isoform X4 [Amaranthus tricolor]|uniref:metal tolerance protein 4-like isoform X4 n=1 Tax=Amaranthus tricolor TaxID=29722 RepID=UPI0025878ED6|nr:metal tolerance protein 4-like isoform X4 [Amaranthus tricolor]